MKNISLLAIESSCDDTSAAVMRNGQILSNCTASQKIHRAYGGVVPELASRAHQQHIVPVVHQALAEAELHLSDLNAVAFTRGPGLMGSLLVGVSFAKALALSLGIPMIEVNHIQAHVLAHFIEAPQPKFPFLCLTVSGGHTQIAKIGDYLDFQTLGTTIDDAAGETFDKTGKLLGLDYPSGPIIDKLAQEGKARFKFSKPHVKGLDFSFSGVKTNILRFLQKNIRREENFIQENLNDICASVQDRIVSILLDRVYEASKITNIKEISIAGGVSANSSLRKEIEKFGQKYGWNIYIPRLEYCTDNAAMIAMTAHYKYLQKRFVDQSVSPLARYTL